MEDCTEDTAQLLKTTAQFPSDLIGRKAVSQPRLAVGEKLVESLGTETERERLAELMAEERTALAGQRVAALKSLSLATWRVDLHLAELTSKKGSVWSVHGHTHPGMQTVLLPEEALFLMECGILELSCAGVPMSLQQAHHTLLEAWDPLDYQAYATLKRMGYAVWRAVLRLGAAVEQEGGEAPGTPLKLASPCPLCSPSGQLCRGLCVLEVFRPRANFAKSNRGAPHCRVVTARPSSSFPRPALLARLSGLSPPAPLKFCIVDGPNTVFYSLRAAAIQPLTQQ